MKNPDAAINFLKSRQHRPEANEEVAAYVDAEVQRIVGELFALVGENVLFIPEVFRSKRPRLTGWNKLTHETLDFNYWKLFRDSIVEGGNLSVLLGPVSGDLVTIDIDRDELVEPLLAVNPLLRDTLCTKGNKGCQFWFRARGLYWHQIRRILNEKGEQIGEWRGGQKSTIWGQHPKSQDYRIVEYQFINRIPARDMDVAALQLPVGWTIAQPSSKDWHGGGSHGDGDSDSDCDSE
jgi:hypothetical protein